TRHDLDSRPEHLPPEIERLDLARTVLELRAAGRQPGPLPGPGAPPPGELRAAGELLRRLSALDGRGEVTAVGRACALLPVHPRLARLAVEAASRGHRAAGCAAAALLHERAAPRDGPAPTGPSDVIDLVDRADLRRDGRIERARAQLLRLAPPEGPRNGSSDEALRISVLAGFPDRVATRSGGAALVRGRGAALAGQRRSRGGSDGGRRCGRAARRRPLARADPAGQ